MANSTSTVALAGGNDVGRSVVVQADGKILVSGTTNNDFAVLRYNSDGTLDTSFSGCGIVTTYFGGANAGSPDVVTSMMLQSDGKILVAGYPTTPYTMPLGFAVVRYNVDGTLDTTFGEDGKVMTDFGGYDRLNGMTLQSDGKILVVGEHGHPFSWFTADNIDTALARYNGDGTLDTSFSEDGMLTTNVGGLDVPDWDSGSCVVVQPDGKIFVAGITGYCFFFLRYNHDGTLDTNFSGDGIVKTDFGGYYDVASMTVQSDGKILVVGTRDDNFALARYNPDGSLDTSFSGDGMLTTDMSGSGSHDYGGSVVVQADGKIVVAGYTVTGFNGPTYNFALLRYNTDGSLDATFGDNGKVTTDFGGNDFAYNVAMQADGKIVVVGSIVEAGTSYEDFALVRYNRDGSLDATFGNGGYADITAPRLSDTSPWYGSTNVPPGCNIVLTFNEMIYAGAGTIAIHIGSETGTVIESYDVTTSANLTISGGTLTINPTETLSYSTSYSVTLSNGSVRDLAGNSFAETMVCNFTTTDYHPLTPMIRNGITVMPERYSGTATAADGAALDFEYLGDSSGEIIIGTPYNDFINSGLGDDAIDAKEGNDVIDGGTGSNFLTGGAGTDIFFSDGRGGVTTWSTITDWQEREQLSVWGWTPGTSRIVEWVQAGAAGYEGLTMHADLNGDGTIDTSVTFTGITSQSQLPTPQEFEGVLWFV